MRIQILAAVAAVFVVLGGVPVEARPAQSRASAPTPASGGGEWFSGAFSKSERRSEAGGGRASRLSSADDGATRGRGGLGPRPSAWCGWYMRTRHGGGPDMNLAWNWSRYGSAASPQVGAIVVWRHHVGEIVGQASNGQWIVLSGNDSGAVRSRARSIAGAVIRI